ncbi:glycosyltransferase family 2 protein [Silanimonas sp.]|uniref:glycosyltransferase family 2 protein n=1 Tax=Silanimonas sp. TaxID=1929290 RepID=UPI0025D3D07D|nr:glycosyltransferase family 2 protein [Silanimonas sp.]
MSGQDQALTDTTGVAAVVVSYNSAATLAACLTSLRMQPELAEIRVIDNGSRDGSMALLEALRTEEPRLRLLRLPGNPGFAAACNLGAAASRSPWLLFVNPDIELPAGALARLLAHAARLPRPGAIGADLQDRAGRRDPAARRHDLSLRRLWAGLGRRDALALAFDERQPLQPVEACSGALLLTPRSAFEAVGGWDAGYRLHVEDLDLCRRLREAGFTIAVANDLPVLHHRGVSSRSRPFFVEWHKHRGLWRYWWRYEARGPARLAGPLVFSLLALRLLAVAWPKAACQVLKTRVG